MLQLFSGFRILCPFLFDLFATDKAGFSVAVIRGHDKINPSINTHDMADISKTAFFYFVGNRDMQKILSMLLYELCSAK